LNNSARQQGDRERTFVALAPTPLIFNQHSASNPAGTKLAPKSVVALDLSRGNSRDRDVLVHWEQQSENRVW
jgi:hypothetical protein